MRLTLTGVFGTIFLAAASLAGPPEDQQLIAEAAAQEQALGTAPAAAAKLSQEERDARTALALSRARLELVLARQDLKAQRLAEAAGRARAVLNLRQELPEGVDFEEYALQAEGILVRAARQGAPVAGAGRPAAQVGPGVVEDYLDRQAGAAQQIARRFSGADTPDIDTSASSQALKARTLARQTPETQGYRPGREIFDTDAILERDRQRLYYEDALQKAYSSDEVRRLMEADEARIAPPGEIAYPDDWPQRIARRQAYAGGQIARSRSWTDANGREWYTAVYDIRDLTYVPPDFQPPFELHPAEELRVALDREALRWRSFIFNGYAEDLAAGIPLLRFFGGIDDYALRGPKYSRQRQEQIVEMIEAFTRPGGEARIISLPPTEP